MKTRSRDGTRLFGRLRPALALAATALLTVSLAVPASADGGTVLYEPNPTTNPKDLVSYEHAIRLQHSGAANGTILATFERFAEVATSPPRGWLIYRSTNNGTSFSRISLVQPGCPTRHTTGRSPCNHTCLSCRGRLAVCLRARCCSVSV